MFRTCFAKFSFRVEFPVCLLTMTYIASPLTCNTPIDPHFFFVCVADADRDTQFDYDLFDR